MSKPKNKKAEAPEVENPQVETPEVQQPAPKPEPEPDPEPEPETEPAPEPEPENNYPNYVKELLDKGVVVIQGRSRDELDEKLAAIPSDVNFYTGAVGQYMGTGLYRIQVNIKED